MAVIGDIHANSEALKAALAQAEERGFDRLVFMGDLLTYGPDVGETLELVLERAALENTVLLQGNHDALYQDLLVGERGYLAKLPAWICESVEWTFQLLPKALWSSLNFSTEYTVQGIIMSHANLLGERRWDYINDFSEHLYTSQVLRARELRAGVFAHTHRRKWFRCESGVGEFLSECAGPLDRAAVHVLNTGSIGQPRDLTDSRPHVLWLTFDDHSEIYIEFEPYTYDLTRHLEKIRRSSMSLAAVEKISRFFV